MAIITFLVGFLQISMPIDRTLRTGFDTINRKAASGEFVVIAVDSESVERVGRWPWPRTRFADLVDRLNDAGVKRIFFDLRLSEATTDAEDHQFLRAIARSRAEIVAPALIDVSPTSGHAEELLPLPQFRPHVTLANINADYDYRGVVWEVPAIINVNGQTVPSFATSMAAQPRVSEGLEPIDYSIDPSTVPTYSASDVLDGQVPQHLLRDRTVVFATTAQHLGDLVFIPGHFRMAGVYVHVLAAETLKRGGMTDLGWLPSFALALLLGVALVRAKSMKQIVGLVTGGAIVLLASSYGLLSVRVIGAVTPAVIFLLVVGGRFMWLQRRLSYKQVALVNPVSSLPNLEALKKEPDAAQGLIVMAHVLNFADVISAMPPERERELVEQIARRLSVGGWPAPYQGDEGLFAIKAGVEDGRALVDHMSALQALFRSPVIVNGDRIDLNISFGVDRDLSRPIANRLSSALVAADEAADEGIEWKYHDSSKLEDSVWRHSLLSQMEDAIESGDLWVAYQPKYSIETGVVVGAEALARWTHPTKGPISPADFVAAAEQNHRVEKLTLHVLDRALAVAAAIRAEHAGFTMAVNLSATLLETREIVDQVKAALDRHWLPPSSLILELTETAAFGSSEAAQATLFELRLLGIGVSIDDYGTGLSTLDYLRRVPATEIKIDRSFVQRLDMESPDRLLVNSTIQLAHSLGFKVVAEGVERRPSLDLLASFGCDLAQGYLLCHPLPFDALAEKMRGEDARRTA